MRPRASSAPRWRAQLGDERQKKGVLGVWGVLGFKGFGDWGFWRFGAFGVVGFGLGVWGLGFLGVWGFGGLGVLGVWGFGVLGFRVLGFWVLGFWGLGLGVWGFGFALAKSQQVSCKRVQGLRCFGWFFGVCIGSCARYSGFIFLFVLLSFWFGVDGFTQGGPASLKLINPKPWMLPVAKEALLNRGLDEMLTECTSPYQCNQQVVQHNNSCEILHTYIHTRAYVYVGFVFEVLLCYPLCVSASDPSRFWCCADSCLDECQKPRYNFGSRAQHRPDIQCAYVYSYIYIYTYMCVYMYIYIYIYICMYVYICKCLCIYIYISISILVHISCQHKIVL